MRSLDDIRALRSDKTNLDAEHLSVAREVLNIEIEQAQPRSRRTTRRPALTLGLGLGLGLGGIGAAVLGTFAIISIVAGSVVAPAGTSSASAAEALEKASRAALAQVSAVDAQLAPGEYLRVETSLDQVTTDGSSSDEPARSGAFMLHSVEVVYVPADRSQDWIVETMAEEVTDVYGPEGQKFADSVLREPGATTEAQVSAYPAGVRTYGDVKQPIDTYRDQYNEMPRDPKALLSWFQANTPDGYAGMAILNALYQNLPPADLRAALLGALSRLPEFTLLAEDGDLATIQRANAESKQQFVINTRTGMLVSVIEPARHPNQIVPRGLPDQVTTFDMSVVDSTPEPTR